MRWSWNWAFLRWRESASSEHERPTRAHLHAPHGEDWERRLVDEGVSEEWAKRIAHRLEPLHRELGNGSAGALIRAAVATLEVHAETHAYVERNMRDVREVEGLLGAFSGELEKLDEVLEVLAAYAQRMRKKRAREPHQTLH